MAVSSAKKLGQDKSLEKSRNSLWKKQMCFFIKKIFSHGVESFEVFHPLKGLG